MRALFKSAAEMDPRRDIVIKDADVLSPPLFIIDLLEGTAMVLATEKHYPQRSV